MCPAPPARHEGRRWPGSSEARPVPRRGLTTTSGLRQRAAEQGAPDASSGHSAGGLRDAAPGGWGTPDSSGQSPALPEGSSPPGPGLLEHAELRPPPSGCPTCLGRRLLVLQCDALNHGVVHQVHPLTAGDRAGLRPHVPLRKARPPPRWEPWAPVCPTPAARVAGAGRPVATPAVQGRRGPPPGDTLDALPMPTWSSVWRRRRQLGAHRPLPPPRPPGSSWGPAAPPPGTDGCGRRPHTPPRGCEAARTCPPASAQPQTGPKHPAGPSSSERY